MDRLKNRKRWYIKINLPIIWFIFLSIISITHNVSAEITLFHSFNQLANPVFFDIDLKAEYAVGNRKVFTFNGQKGFSEITSKPGFGKAVIQTGTPDAIRYDRIQGDGINDAVGSDYTDNMNRNQGTLELWWRPGLEALGGENSYFFVATDTDNKTAANSTARGAFSLAYNVSGKQLYFFETEAENYPSEPSACVVIDVGNLVADKWYHVAMAYDNVGVQIFFNGQISSKLLRPLSLTDAHMGPYINIGHEMWNNLGIHGAIDAVQFSDEVLYSGEPGKTYRVPTIEMPKKMVKRTTDTPAEKKAGVPDYDSTHYPVDKIQKEEATRLVNSAQEEETEEITNSKKIYTLDGGFVRYEVNLNNGQFMGAQLGSVQANKKILGRLLDTYGLSFGNGKSMESDELQDSVMDVVEKNKRRVVLECRNAELDGIKFIKEYALEDGILSKTVRVVCDAKNPVLLSIRSLMDPLELKSSQQDRYGFNVSPGYFPENATSIFWMDQSFPAGCQMMPCFVYPKDGVTIGMYLHKINGRFIYARENDNFAKEDGLLKSGTLALEFIGQDRNFAYEYHIRTVLGDALNYYRAYQKLKGYVDIMSDQQDPDWFDRVRFITDCGTMDLLKDHIEGSPLPKESQYAPWWAELSVGDTSRNSSMFVLFAWNGVGALPTEGKWDDSAVLASYPLSVETVRWELDCLRTKWQKVALYDWNVSYDPKISPFKDHPEWAAYDENGNTMVSFYYGVTPIWPEDVKPNYLNKDFRRYHLGQEGKLPSVYGVDFYYIDAEVGDRYPDWKTTTVFQQYHRMDYLKAIRHSSGRELPLLKNTPNLPYCSAYLWEGRGLYSQGMEDRWQAMGSKMLVDKIWQWQHRPTALMKWGWTANEPYYINYIIGLGYKPHAPDEPLRKYSYMQAAFEMRHLRLMDTKFSPCFWRNEETNTEVYLLEQGRAIYLSCIGHGNKNEKVKISIDGQGLPFAQGTPLFVWQIKLDNPNDMPEELNQEYKVRVANSKDIVEDKEFVRKWKEWRVAHNEYRGLINMGPLVSVQADVRPTLLTMLVISDLPVLVLGEGDEMTQMQVPGTADIKLDGDFELENKRFNLKVSTDKPCRLGFLAPEGLRIQKILFENETIKHEIVRIGDTDYSVVNLPAGSVELKVFYLDI